MNDELNAVRDYMSAATDVKSWNILREQLTKSLAKTYKNEVITLDIPKVGRLKYPKYLAIISELVDSSGLIVKLLGKDYPGQVSSYANEDNGDIDGLEKE